MMNKKRRDCLADQSEYIAVDVVRFICSFLVMAIHFLIFEDINKELNFWFTQVFCRWAVPFFFVTSGYFLANKMGSKQAVKLYLRRILGLYIIYTVIYIPIIVESYKELGYSRIRGVSEFLRAFFLTGSFFHLWYFLALIVAIGILYWLINKTKLSDEQILGVTGALYCIGTLGNAYRNIWIYVPAVDKVFSLYESVFVSTTNGIFFGAFFVMIGYYIRAKSADIKYRMYWLAALLLFGLMNIEEYFARSITYHVGQSMLFTTPFVVTAIFLMVCFIRIPKRFAPVGVFLRNMSVLIYGFHAYIHFQYGGEISGYVMHGFVYYFMIAKRVIILSVIIWLLSRIKIFSWLKYLY